MNKVVRIKLSDWIAKQKKMPEEIRGYLISETEKAIQVEYYTLVKVWLPKSQITIETTEKQGE